ncbi:MULTISPECIES: phosphatidylinositol phosphate synthase [unclassified Actinomyces]|uniref:phosphatidylinositol phosphate synthase n=1 Tax=unclassified Actinomyces TaxID=2609248 RepID=UPI002017C324|nr:MULTISPECIES: CDP-alcohol phosphatidyltransferase family protein [unclassified Actinomyces]MCL3778356.1 CDP-alcohol phosphatidyltransferase family protein [Actinomyces sp. AC-20-1]MCL3790197.1 CDP-alcohol phosphatidyltransferase family protein [Actinomyces sp. 187325]MCL3792492.1 CDP-alcohol phosphatidyltransferase family protein [Actinomyces sp. 186855]MCL3794328.1 CDP-alcohol phosphatidyltransferase family protein [Actinomyces sp. 217892]
MLGQHGRGLTKALFTRPALALARLGVTPNMLTVTGTLLTVLVAVTTLPQGRFLLGVALLALVVVGDSFDGILARATGTTSVFGAFLDSTMDRVADGAVFGSLVAWAALRLEAGALRTTTIACGLAVVVLAEVVSYARAKAESIGTSASVGVAERTDRLVVAGAGALAVGLGAPQWVLTAALGIVAVGSLVTVVQRVLTVRGQLRQREQAPDEVRTP